MLLRPPASIACVITMYLLLLVVLSIVVIMSMVLWYTDCEFIVLTVHTLKNVVINRGGWIAFFNHYIKMWSL